MRRIAIIVLILFFLGAAFRVPYLDHNDIHVDEHHWVQRSEILLKQIISNPFIATTHLGQPGVVPAFVMAFGQGASKLIAHIRGATPNALYASRLSCAFVSSLVAPLLFLFCLNYFSHRIALLAGIIIALDTTTIGFSRMAHLDTIHGLLIMGCVFFYALGVEREQVFLKLLSGGFWGLAAITKPTSAFLIPAFIFWKALRINFCRWDEVGEKRIISWSDLGTAFIGFSVMSLLYTRFWVHNSDYIWRLKIKSYFADVAYSAGFWLHSTPVVPILLLVLIFVFLRLSLNGFTDGAKSNLRYSAIALSIFLATFSAFPQVYENLIRYWTWAFGLKEMHHAAHGVVYEEASTNYLTLFFIRNQEIIIISILMGVSGLFFKLKKGYSDKKEIFILLCVLCSVIWFIGLSASTKRTWRYAMPVLPLLSVVAAYGITRIAACFALINPTIREKATTFLSIIVPVALFCETVVFAPHFELFFNPSSGGLKKWISETNLISTVGQDDALDFLMQQAYAAKKTIYVSALVGDKDVLSYGLFRKYGHDSRFVSFGYFKPQVADYVIAQPRSEGGVFNADWDWLKDESPLFYAFFRGVDMLHIYDVPFIEFNEPDVRLAHTLHHLTGKVENISGVQGSVLVSRPKHQKAGPLAFMEGYRVKEGTYEVLARVWSPMRSLVWKSQDPKTDVLALELLPFCSKHFEVKDLSNEPLTVISLRCKVDQPSRVEPRVTWYGRIPVALRDLAFRKAQ